MNPVQDGVYTLRRFSIHQGMKYGQEEAQERTYRMVVGKSGKRWLYSIQPNAADNVYVEGSTEDKYFKGFGGATINFTLFDGRVIALTGPWHSNAQSLYEDTGVDVRDQHITQGIIALKREPTMQGGEDLYIGVVHYDEKPVIGEFNRIEFLAQQLANELKTNLVFGAVSNGGGCGGYVEPKFS